MQILLRTEIAVLVNADENSDLAEEVTHFNYHNLEIYIVMSIIDFGYSSKFFKSDVFMFLIVNVEIIIVL